MEDMMQDLAFLMAERGPDPVVPFSPVVRVGRFLFVTGQMPTLPGRGTTPVAGGVVGQTQRVMDNLARLLASRGVDFTRVVMAWVCLAAAFPESSPDVG
jgi:2-iminobutanoate/2-iminopropanoate deaminase